MDIDSKKPSHEERFHVNVVGLGHVICDLVKTVEGKGHTVVNPHLVELAVCLLSKLDHTTVIETFIYKSNEKEGEDDMLFEDHCWTKIKNRNRSFFIENAGEIFSDLPANRVDAFSRMFSLVDKQGNSVVPEDDENEIWDFFESLVKIAIKYIHSKRKPQLLRRGTEETRRYQDDTFLSKVNLALHAECWKIDLVFPEI